MSDPQMPDVWDVIVIGSGGAGCAAAIEAKVAGATVLIITKSAPDDSKTAQAQGGIQAALGPGDTPDQHFRDTWEAGQQKANEKLVRILADRAPETIHWLEELGVNFDRDGGSYRLASAAGLSAPRVLSCGDTAGKGIAQAVLRRVAELQIPVWHGTGVHSISPKEAGFILTLLREDASGSLQVCARTIVLATGGVMAEEKKAGLAAPGGAEAKEGIALATELGARVVHPDLVQYHPTGVLLPKELRRKRLPEGMRAAGAPLLNRDGVEFVDPLLTRNALTEAIVSECRAGRGIETDDGRVGVWLHTPTIEKLHGSGFIQERFPTFWELFLERGHNLAESPVLVFPILHYTLGGVEIDEHAETSVTNLFAAGEITWGVHGTERLMGNSLLDIFVFGRIAGRSAAARSLSSQ